jgi:asparagine synthase (glutamine-hydrolysing)
MDGQEIALRLMAWSFGFYAFLDSPSTKPEYVSQFVTMVAAQAQRIYRNLGYAISTQSNHTISEACGLWLTGTLFPELNGSDEYLSVGRKLLEGEAVRQLFPDGSYSMYSLNYHRFVLQTYFYVMRLGELNHSKFPESVYRVATSSIAYLAQLIDPQTGQLPVYGSNDGALVLPLNDCDFTDYRPLLQLGSFMTNRRRIFEPGPWDEDLFWLCGPQSLQDDVEKSVQADRGFSDGGIYVLHGPQSKVVIHCTDFRSRPSHADQLHVDVWWQGHNIACDAGTYLYSGSGPWRNGLAHTDVHNTVSVDSNDQMSMVSRFTWINWAQGNVLQQAEDLWRGEHDGYRRLSDPVTHKRTIHKLGNDRWLVIDHLHGAQPHHYALHWLLNDFPYIKNGNSICLWPETGKYKVQMGLMEGESTFSLVRADPNSTRGWRSRYYGHKEPAISAMLEADRPNACFWTFFGFESDLIGMEGKMLTVKSPGMNSSIDLAATDLNTPL